MSSSSPNWIPVPTFIRRLCSHFPLYYYPPSIAPATRNKNPILWITPPTYAPFSILSGDVECLKWQAYLALRGISDIQVRWDIAPAGGVDGRLPSLLVPSPNNREKKIGDEIRTSPGELLSARMIPGWADGLYGEHVWSSELEGYLNEHTRDESRAWISLLEGPVHAGLILSQPPESLLSSWLYFTPSPSNQLPTILTPPPSPLTGITTLLPPHGVRLPIATLRSRYREAIGAISERLGTDKWFLGSSGPTPLDALLFAYLHATLNLQNRGQEHVRAEVTRRVNLVAWERKVRSLVQGAFRPLHTETDGAQPGTAAINQT